VKVVFSSRFKQDLARYEQAYCEISGRLAGDFRERIAGITSEIIRWKGGDHTGPHGYPCRRSKPFPFYVYYQQDQQTLRFLAIVHEKRHPEFLKRQP